MSLFKRVSDNIRANLNSLLDKAEDPEKMLDQYLRDMEEDIAEAEVAVAKQLAVAWKFKAQLDDAVALVEKREAQAMEALGNNREDLARRALEDKKINKAKSEEFRRQHESSSAMAEQLRSELKEMKNEYEKLRIKRDTLVARAQAAKAQQEIHGAVSGLGKDSTRRNFDRMEDKVLRMEAEAKVAGDLREKDLDQELESLGKDAEIEKELAALKERLMTKNE
ncbi:PspA/IM30 family protein [Desulfitobacterium hafniense]|uniref:Phage shock protein A n=6 Tax=root TaxID=1 RepID=Q24VL6_DESHY|nr:PspA/IM30 family protein [Desulfitobacterium hafniense]ACL21335.1 phage shock protein A, PspA [Desulfitobacterium hafniense DCB-2]EHL07535.1 PspA/IM30 family protein [Desulfitobacterium hafniense DP7]KTE92629.1 phage shock protein A [Desulfitobacterium hafniense]MEA5022958.1 PspA/IM30 family protein [Desulfitobacterium hafniense]CDX02255.1 PspA/IM30 protein [Desulfitobacterium hafniense]